MRNERGATLVVVLIVLVLLVFGLYYIITRAASSGVDALADAGMQLDETRRQRTLTDMRTLADAIQRMQADSGNVPGSLTDLQRGGYLALVPMTDGWGNAFAYVARRGGFELASQGSDGRSGPAPPQPWIGGSYACDLVLTNGQFTQAPAGR